MTKENNAVDKLPIEKMAEIMETQKTESGSKAKIYKVESDQHRDEVISGDILNKLAQLQKLDGRQKMNWADLDLVKERVYAYLTACAEASTVPTVTGLASLGFGVSRQALNFYMSNHPGTDTTEYLETVKDTIASIVQEEALKNQLNPVMTIFTLKNGHAFTDKVEIDTPLNNRPGAFKVKTPEELEKALEKMPGLDLIDLPMEDSTDNSESDIRYGGSGGNDHEWYKGK